MNQVLSPASFTMPVAGHAPSVRSAPARQGIAGWTRYEETARIRRTRSLLGLFVLYAAALLVVVTLSEGADIGCILGAIAGHVVYALRRVGASWRDAAALHAAKARFVSLRRRRP
jgi:hypothetical protein